MKPVFIMVILFVMTAASCNNDAAEKKTSADTIPANLPEPGTIFSDTLQSPETQADTSNSTPKR